MNEAQAKSTLRGPMVSVATPFDRDFKVDLDALHRHIRFMIDHGLRSGQGVLLVAAAGGEFPMLRMDERKAICEASVEAAAGEVPVAASIQFNSTLEVVDLARFAADVGICIGQLSAPSYYRPTAGDILTHFKMVSDETNLPIMVYTNWWVTPEMNAGIVEKLSELSNVVAVKWSAPEDSDYERGLELFAERMAIIDNRVAGMDSYRKGAVGFITHVGNFWPEFPVKAWNLLEEGDFDEAERFFTAFNKPFRAWCHEVTEITEGEGPFIKAAMDAVGLYGGSPRPPASPVNTELRKKLAEILEAAGAPRYKN